MMPRILLVEDNDMNRDMLSRRLERRGYDVLIAVDGAAGVQMATEQTPDLVIMDLRLPVLDGWEATRRIKAHPVTCGTPVVALTADAFVEDREKALAAGCDGFETKPVEFHRLLMTIELLLGESAPR
jgi:CheY-like chemotaxis protein